VTKKDDDLLKQKLDSLSRRIEKRVHELQQQGEFSDIAEPGLADIRSRAATIKERLDAAMSKDDTWDIVKYEFERDLNSLGETFATFEESLDVRAMKQKDRSALR
jgi:hypothetical protein